MIERIGFRLEVAGLGKITIELIPTEDAQKVTLRGRHADPESVRRRIEKGQVNRLSYKLEKTLGRVFGDGDFSGVTNYRPIRGRHHKTPEEKAQDRSTFMARLVEIRSELEAAEKPLTQPSFAQKLKMPVDTLKSDLRRLGIKWGRDLGIVRGAIIRDELLHLHERRLMR